jgi:RimJ/RimL family protein N-acetyltransferase
MPETRPPHLTSARLSLRPRAPADLEDCLAMDCDPAVARFIWGSPPDRDARRAVLEEQFRAGQPAPGGIWIVEETAAPGFLGWCALMPLEVSGLIEIGYRYLPKAWGRGIATEAATRLLDHGFRELALDPIVAVSHPENRASHRVLEKIGLAPSGTAFHYGQDLAFFRRARADHLASGPAAATRSGLPRSP